MSSRELLRTLHTLGFHVVSMRGSHAKLSRENDGERQILTVPVHAELAPGTLRAVVQKLGRVAVLPYMASYRDGGCGDTHSSCLKAIARGEQ